MHINFEKKNEVCSSPLQLVNKQKKNCHFTNKILNFL